MRTVYSNKMNDYDSLNVDYKYLNVWSGGGDREIFRYSGMPDLVYDRNNPSSFYNTWIKCFYTKDRFAATVFGGKFTRDVNTIDQNGNPLSVLPDGAYTLKVAITDEGQSTPIAYAEREINIGTYPDKITSPFQPDEHFYIYNMGIHSTAYELEIGHVESADKNLDRVKTYYYDIGELRIEKNKGSLFQMDTSKSPVVFTQAEYLTPETTLGDGHVDMRTLDTASFTRLASRDAFVCSVGEVVALYGVCAPIMSVGDIKMNPETSNYSLNNRIETIQYSIDVPTYGPYAFNKKVDLFRDYATTNFESVQSGFEFKRDFTIPSYWAGKKCTVTY